MSVMQSENYMSNSWFVIVAVDQHKKMYDASFFMINEEKDEIKIESEWKKSLYNKDWIHWFLSSKIDKESNHRILFN